MIPKIHTGLTERQMHRRFWLASSGSVLAGLSVALAAYAAHAGLGDKAQGNLQHIRVFEYRVVYQLQDFRDKVGKADISLNLCVAIR